MTETGSSIKAKVVLLSELLSAWREEQNKQVSFPNREFKLVITLLTVLLTVHFLQLKPRCLLIKKWKKQENTLCSCIDCWANSTHVLGGSGELVPQTVRILIIPMSLSRIWGRRESGCTRSTRTGGQRLDDYIVSSEARVALLKKSGILAVSAK